MKNPSAAAANTVPETLTAVQFAAIVGFGNTRRVRELVAEGIIERSGKNSYPIEGVAAYCDHLRTSDSSPDDVRFKKARASLYEEKARTQKRLSDLISGQCHDAESVVFFMGQAVAASRAKLLSIPNSCAAVVADISDPDACRRVLDDACREAAEALSNYDPGKVVENFRKSSKKNASPEVLEESDQ